MISNWKSSDDVKATRFTLKPKHWYACRFLGDELGDNTCSPIRVDRLEPKGGGKRLLDLHLYHADYPAGVRNKCYTLRTLERGRHFMLAL